MNIAIKFIILSTFLFAHSGCAAQQEEKQICAVAFYNLENLFDPADDRLKFDEDFTPNGANKYTEKIYRKKLHNMAYAISQLALDKTPDGPALIGVAEVENKKVLTDLVNEPELKQRKYNIAHFESPDARGIDVGFLYQPKYFKLITAKAIKVNINSEFKKEQTRDVLYVTGILAKDTVHVLVNHWPSRREGTNNSDWKRMNAATANKQIIDKLVAKNKNAKIIVMGDFNDNPTDQSISVGLQAKPEKTNMQNTELFNPFAKLYKQGFGTAVYKNNWDMFDQIMVSKGLVMANGKGWQLQGQEIFNAKFLQNPFGKMKGNPHRSFSGNRFIDGFSDHFPVIIYLTQ